VGGKDGMKAAGCCPDPKVRPGHEDWFGEAAATGIALCKRMQPDIFIRSLALANATRHGIPAPGALELAGVSQLAAR
jgi:hypothetical protein